jgi:Carboxypeptidase regulatory-like domain
VRRAAGEGRGAGPQASALGGEGGVEPAGRADGLPLDGATVRLDGPQASSGEAAGPTVTLTLVSDGNGYFGATDLAPGRYAVTVESGRAVLARVPAVVRAGEVLTLDLRAG